MNKELETFVEGINKKMSPLEVAEELLKEPRMVDWDGPSFKVKLSSTFGQFGPDPEETK